MRVKYEMHISALVDRTNAKGAVELINLMRESILPDVLLRKDDRLNVQLVEFHQNVRFTRCARMLTVKDAYLVDWLEDESYLYVEFKEFTVTEEWDLLDHLLSAASKWELRSRFVTEDKVNAKAGS